MQQDWPRSQTYVDDGDVAERRDTLAQDLSLESEDTIVQRPGRSSASGRQLVDASAREKTFTRVMAVLLLSFGIYLSILYFGHQVVPNPDFTAFLQLGYELLSLEMPSSFKRAPVLGLLQAGLSHFVGGAHPELTAGWLLNAALYPLSVLFLWLIARRIVGRVAGWLALLAAINPWSLSNLPDPIAEVTLQFFVLATFYAIFTQSRWRYVMAAVTTMVRYDGAALIVVAFVLDMARARLGRQRFAAVLGAALACVPLGFWLLGTVLNFANESSTHYLNELGTDGALAGVAVHYVGAVWSVAVAPLFAVPSSLPGPMGVVLSRAVAGVLLAGFCFGMVQGIVKRQWEVIGLLIFLGLYLLVHSLHSFVLQRFCSTVFWIVLLVTCFGLQGLWARACRWFTLSDKTKTALQAIVCVILLLWVADIARLLPQLAGNSVRSRSVPAVAVLLVAVFVAARQRYLQRKEPMRNLLTLLVLGGIIVSNQGTLVLAVGNGEENIEFKHLADWCHDNTLPEQRVASTYAGVLGVFLPERKADFIHTGVLKAESLDGFAENCRREGVTYVAWDSRLGAARNNRYHAFYGLDALTDLGEPANAGPFEFVTQINTDIGRYINVFSVRSCELSSDEAL